jgi:ABC-type bacteriocin/lantibiotic exporter with double-glycine peptidase domain
MLDYIGVIMTNNFYFNGTLRENITWKRGPLTTDEEHIAIGMAKLLLLDTDLKDFDELLLDCPIQFL